MSTPASAAIVRLPTPRRVNVFDDTPVADEARRAAAAGCGLVHKGDGHVYWTPRRMPGEFAVAEAAA